MSSPVRTRRDAMRRVSGRRVVRRRRLTDLGRFVALTVVVGTLSVALSLVRPELEPAAAVATGPTALEMARLAVVTQPASAVVDLDDTAQADLREKAQLAAATHDEAALPPDSGKGRRIVFSESAQRVWLVGGGGEVERTYLVSGSKFDNLNPGTYKVQSRSRHATAFDYSGSMEYFVRFATGFTAPIGFHTVPVDNAGRPEQKKAELGTPQSAGCVRQWRDDAIALWKFAPIGTKVVVTT